MHKDPDPIRQRESTVLLALLALFIFASPLTVWWASDTAHWLTPYFFWLLIILISGWLRHRFKQNDL
jgi:hypothetical protein